MKFEVAITKIIADLLTFCGKVMQLSGFLIPLTDDFYKCLYTSGRD